MKKWLVIIIVLAVGLGLAACTRPTPTPPAAATTPAETANLGNVFHIAVASDLSTLNVWAAYDANISIWNHAVYNSFWPAAYTLTYHRWDLIPDLATDFPSDLDKEGDYWVCTVPLRQDAVWSDGSPITAEDWAWTAETVLAFDLGGNWQNYDRDYLDHIQALDAHTAKLFYHTRPGLAQHQYGTLQAPILNHTFWRPLVAPLLEDASGLADLDPESEDYLALRDELSQQLYQMDPTGEPISGPWLLESREPGIYSELVRNPDYYGETTQVIEYASGGYTEIQGGKQWGFGDQRGAVQSHYTKGPWFDRVRFTVYGPEEAVAALAAGEVDFFLTPDGLSSGQLGQVAGRPDIRTVQNPANNFRFLAFNFSRPPLDDLAVRQAINCLVDKQFLAGNLLHGEVIPAYSVVPQGNALWYNPDTTLYCDGLSAQERLAEAVRILQDAGYTWDEEPSWSGDTVTAGQGLTLPDGVAFPPLELLAPDADSDPLRATAGAYIEQQMNILGMPTSANLTDLDSLFGMVFGDGEWDMFILGWGVTPLPDYVCDLFYTDADYNVIGYSNSELDAVCDEFLVEADIGRAQELNDQLQEMVAVDLPYVYLFTTSVWDAWNSSTVSFPFTDVNDGIGYGAYGLKEYAQPVQ